MTLRSVGDHLLRLRYLLMLALSGCYFAVWYPSRPLAGDWWIFEYGARVIGHVDGEKYQRLSDGWQHVYASMPKLQIGPPALLLAIPSQLLPPMTGRLVMAIVMAASGVALVGALELLARRVRPHDRSIGRTAAVAGLLLVPAWNDMAVRYMHLDDVLVLTLLVAAIWAIERHRWVVVAVALGTAIATKPWALAFVVLIAVLPRREVFRAAVVTCIATVVWWIPFVLADRQTVSNLWNVQSDFSHSSTLALLGFSEAPIGARGLQFALMLLGASIAVRRGRWVAAPLIAVAIRLVTDWQTWGYYGAALVLAALLIDVLRSESRWPVVTGVAVVAAGLPTWLAGIDGTAAAIARLALISLTCAAAWRAAYPTTETGAEAVRPTGNVLEYSS